MKIVNQSRNAIYDVEEVNFISVGSDPEFKIYKIVEASSNVVLATYCDKTNAEYAMRELIRMFRLDYEIKHNKKFIMTEEIKTIGCYEIPNEKELNKEIQIIRKEKE